MDLQATSPVITDASFTDQYITPIKSNKSWPNQTRYIDHVVKEITYRIRQRMSFKFYSVILGGTEYLAVACVLLQGLGFGSNLNQSLTRFGENVSSLGLTC